MAATADRTRKVVKKAGAIAGITALIALVALMLTTPRTTDLAQDAPAATSYMRVRARAVDGAPTQPPSMRRWAQLSAIAPIVSCAVVKAEDRGFFRHQGIEPAAMRRAALRYVTGKHGGGGSTITQQLARNLYLTPARTPLRKVRELIIAHRLEATLSKRRILELYLNLVEWGDGIWGVEDASRYYFGVASSHVNTFQAVSLGALLAAPLEEPKGHNGKRVYQVQRRVVRQLADAGLITLDDKMLTLQAIEEWHGAILNGQPWRAALVDADERYRRSRSANAPSHPWSISMGTSCGYEEERLHESLRDSGA